MTSIATGTDSATRRSAPITEQALTAMLVVAWAWFFLPLALIVTLRLPPYAFGHEPIGVRYFQAWVPLNSPGDYPFVLVGYVLDFIHRGLLSVLIRSGYAPEQDLVRSMTIFSNTSLLIHTTLIALIAGLVVRNPSLPLPWRTVFLVTGVSLGYLFYWGPLHLFIPDYPLTLIVVAYGFLGFATLMVHRVWGGHPDITRTEAWCSASHLALLTTAVLSLKPSLVPYAALIFVVGASAIPGRRRFAVLSAAAGATLLALAALWLFLHGFDLYTAVYAGVELASGLAQVRGVEASFRMTELVSPGSIYFVPLLGSIFWLIIAGMALIAPTDRRFRAIPGTALAGGLFYVYVLARRPGNATMFEILVYLAVTGTLCVILQHPAIRPRIVLLWCTLLLAQTSAVARSALPSLVSGARHTAQVARDVDHYARSFALPILYVYPDAGPAVNDVFQSAESAVFKGTLHCTFVEAACDRVDRDRVFSLVLPPYRVAASSEKLPSSQYVLLFADVADAPSVVAQSGAAHAAFVRARHCRQWEQWRHIVHVCAVPAHQ